MAPYLYVATYTYLILYLLVLHVLLFLFLYSTSMHTVLLLYNQSLNIQSAVCTFYRVFFLIVYLGTDMCVHTCVLHVVCVY